LYTSYAIAFVRLKAKTKGAESEAKPAFDKEGTAMPATHHVKKQTPSSID
jgi:hypothetical protein